MCVDVWVAWAQVAADRAVCECRSTMFEPVQQCGLYSPPPPIPTSSLGYAQWLTENLNADSEYPLHTV